MARKRAPARRTKRRSPRRRRNPALVSQLRTGLKDAAAIVVGKATARVIPTFVPGVPRTGPLGLIVQAASAVLAGFAADRFLGRDISRMVLAGGLSAPIETAVVAYHVPLLGPALDPTASAGLVAAAAAGGVGAYVQPRRVNGGGRMGAYVMPGSLQGYAPGWQPFMGQ